jgi:hypothetical protein
MHAPYEVSAVPVLLLSWRRPDLTQEVLQSITGWEPRDLFLTCDGWNDGSDAKLIQDVKATREILDQNTSWPCNVLRLYAPAQVGLRFAASSAPSWFFDEVEYGLILEDDCVPSSDYVAYCAELLSRYRDERRVMAISGDNSASVTVKPENSYTFVRYPPSTWGMATWRRAWALYDADLDRVESQPSLNWERLLPDPIERQVWLDRYRALREPGGPDSWALVWTLSMLMQDGLAIQPRVNLVANTGFGARATHTTESAEESPRALAATSSILPLRHPDSVELDEAASREVFEKAHGGAQERRRIAWKQTPWGRFRVALHRHLTSRLPSRSLATGRPRLRR